MFTKLGQGLCADTLSILQKGKINKDRNYSIFGFEYESATESEEEFEYNSILK